MTQCRGFTLLELLITLVLLSTALGMALPPIRQAVDRSAVRAESRELLRLVKLARQSAVFGATRVVVCSVDGTQHCSRDWGEVVVVFTDHNGNNQIDPGDRRIHHWQRGKEGVDLVWRGFGPGYLRYLKAGTAVDNGAFTLCPRSGDRSKARQLIVNRVGRPYLSRDVDADGVVEYGDDREPSC